ncbi:MAG: acyltransferase [Bacteroidaceae bacterium]|nr:acyltransferase [Bacteroidaceae bacterium]
MTSARPRNHAFDLLCGLCIVRMVMLHVVGMCHLRGELWFQKLMAWTFFFLCFFFFKAGYFNRTVGGSTRAFVWDKARRLLLPYVCWGLIGNLVYFGFLYGWPRLFASTLRQVRWSHLWEASQFYGNPPVWFLFSFFMMYVIVHLWRRWTSGPSPQPSPVMGREPSGTPPPPLWGEVGKGACSFLWLLLPALSYWLWTRGNPLWMSLGNVPMGVFCFELGHWWHEAERRLPRGWFVALSVALVVLFLYGNHHWHGECDMALNKWVQRPWGSVLNTTCAVCGLSGLLLSLPLRRVPWLGFVGEHSMVFFVMHYPLIFLYRMGLQVAHVSVCGQWAHGVGMLVLIFLVCGLLVPRIEKVPWLSGRFPKK